MQIDPYFSLCTKNNKSKWIKDLNLNPETLNLIKENIGISHKCISTEENFLNITPIVQAINQQLINGAS